jgi:hypothetical protein
LPQLTSEQTASRRRDKSHETAFFAEFLRVFKVSIRANGASRNDRPEVAKPGQRNFSEISVADVCNCFPACVDYVVLAAAFAQPYLFAVFAQPTNCGWQITAV